MNLKLGTRLVGQIRRENDGSSVLTLRGNIDEGAELDRVVPAVKYPLRIDLGGVERINSVGVRFWIQFIAAVSGAGSVTLLRCPEIMVQQFSYVSSALGGAAVASVLAPYVCAKCGASMQEEVTIGPGFDPDTQPSEKPCKRCGGAAQFDDVPDSYFLFLQSP